MLKKIISKICLCFFLVFIFSVNTGCKKRVDENRLISASEWIVNSYNDWCEDDGYYYDDMEASYEFFDYLIEEEVVENKYLNFIYLDNKAVYFVSNDGKYYVAYEALYDGRKLQGEMKYVGFDKSIDKLIEKLNISSEYELYYELNEDGTSKTNSYYVTFKDYNGNIIKQIDKFGKKVDSLLVNEGKTVSLDYNTTNYKIEGSKTIARLIKGWEYEGEILTSPITVTSDMELTVALEEKEGLVSNGRDVFNSIEDAIKNSKTGDTLVLMKDLTVKDLVIPEGITLLIPADNENNILQIPGKSDASKNPVDDKPFVTLTVDNLTVNGALHIASVIGYPGSGGACQGHTSGSHGLLVVNNKMTVNGLVDSSGYIKGNGKADIYGTLNIPFIVRDFRGGTNTVGVYMNGSISPFNVYELINVQIETTYYSSATLNAYGNLYASGQYNIAKSAIIGKDGVIVLNDNSKATINYDAKEGHGSIRINGGAVDGSFSLTVMGINVSIDNVFFPLPYKFDIILENGTYDLNSSYKLLTGCKFIIEDDAICNLNNEFIVYSNFKDTAFAGSCYPELEGGLLECYGTLNINHNFGGLVTLQENGKINVSKTYLDKKTNTNKDIKLSLVSKEGYADSSGFVITSEINEIAQYIKNGTIYSMEIGKNYK